MFLSTLFWKVKRNSSFIYLCRCSTIISKWKRMISSRKSTHNNAGEDVEKRQPYCIVGGEYELVQPLWKTVWRLLTKLGAKLPYDPARASRVVQLIKTLFASAGDYPWLRTSPRRREWLYTPLFLPGKIPRTEESRGLQSIGPQRITHYWSNLAHTRTHMTQPAIPLLDT